MPFSENSFDVVIGNPLLCKSSRLIKETMKKKHFMSKIYKVANGTADLVCIFLWNEVFKNVKPNNGKLRFIYYLINFISSDFGKGIRRSFIRSNKSNMLIAYFTLEAKNGFEDASTYTCRINLSHNNEKLHFKSISPNDIFNPFEY